MQRRGQGPIQPRARPSLRITARDAGLDLDEMAVGQTIASSAPPIEGREHLFRCRQFHLPFRTRAHRSAGHHNQALIKRRARDRARRLMRDAGEVAEPTRAPASSARIASATTMIASSVARRSGSRGRRRSADIDAHAERTKAGDHVPGRGRDRLPLRQLFTQRPLQQRLKVDLRFHESNSPAGLV